MAFLVWMLVFMSFIQLGCGVPVGANAKSRKVNPGLMRSQARKKKVDSDRPGHLVVDAMAKMSEKVHNIGINKSQDEYSVLQAEKRSDDVSKMNTTESAVQVLQAAKPPACTDGTTEASLPYMAPGSEHDGKCYCGEHKGFCDGADSLKSSQYYCLCGTASGENVDCCLTKGFTLAGTTIVAHKKATGGRCFWTQKAVDEVKNIHGLEDAKAGQLMSQNQIAAIFDAGGSLGGGDIDEGRMVCEEAYSLIKSDVECNSWDVDLGLLSSATDCADAVREDGGKFFVYGKGDKELKCYKEKTENAKCPEGFQPDSFDFYTVGPPPPDDTKCKCNGKTHAGIGDKDCTTTTLGNCGGGPWCYTDDRVCSDGIEGDAGMPWSCNACNLKSGAVVNGDYSNIHLFVIGFSLLHILHRDR